jgi:hypothetical protein
MTTLPIEVPTAAAILAAVDTYGRAEYRRGQPVAHSRDIAVRGLERLQAYDRLRWLILRAWGEKGGVGQR